MTISNYLSHIAILAGGQSRRMGQNKARLLFEQQILLKRLVDDAHAMGLQTLLCADDLSYPEVYHQRSDKHIIASPDLLENKSGALSAFQPALEYGYHAGESWLWVMACDSLVRPSELLPFFTTALKKADDDTQLILARAKKTLPLTGLYRTDLYAPMKYYLLAGERRVMAFCHQYSVQEIALPEALASCCNFNTPAEYERVKAQYLNQKTHRAPESN